MADLTVFATIATELNPAQLSKRFGGPLHVHVSEDGLVIESDLLLLNLTSAGADELLLRGHLEDLEYFKIHVLPALKAAASQLQIDIFEEDGRLIQRISEI